MKNLVRVALPFSVIPCQVEGMLVVEAAWDSSATLHNAQIATKRKERIGLLMSAPVVLAR
jgi:hypothetical protein